MDKTIFYLNSILSITSIKIQICINIHDLLVALRTRRMINDLIEIFIIADH